MIMLEQTFIHIPGVGRQTERELWENGIHNWDDADCFEKRFGRLGTRLQRKLDDYIPKSREAIKHKNAAFFERLSALGEAWRLFPDFSDDYLHSKVTHDEVDAITSALVGLFYMADEYIGLGNAAEDYLIVPKSLRINYRKLSDILVATGLDRLEYGGQCPTSHHVQTGATA